MKIAQLNHVALHVNDVDASIRFYRDVLGLRLMPRPAFDFPGAWFEIAPPTSSSPAQELHLIGRVPETDLPPRDRHFAMLVTSMPEAEKHLKSRGVKFEGPNDRPDGAKQIFLRDPDGHVIELCTTPSLASRTE